MNSSALILMASVMIVVISITGFFFYKVLTIPPRAEPDSFSENDDEAR